MATVLIAPQRLETYDKPVVFLAGPIQGAADWQSEAIKKLGDLDIIIANPRRGLKLKGDFTQEMYNEQVDWETEHLNIAGKKGIVTFWLANEYEKHTGRAYGQTTRFEFGEWKVKHQVYGTKVIVGIDNQFSGQRYVRRRLAQDCPNIPIVNTFDEYIQEIRKRL